MTDTQIKSVERRLFADLVECTGVDYLSDLHLPGRYADIIQALERMTESDYPRAQWIELFRYILPQTGTGAPAMEEGSVKERLIMQLKALI